MLMSEEMEALMTLRFTNVMHFDDRTPPVSVDDSGEQASTVTCISPYFFRAGFGFIPEESEHIPDGWRYLACRTISELVDVSLSRMDIHDEL